MKATDNNQPPQKCQASSILDYDLDQLTEYPLLVSNAVTPSSSNPSNSTNIMKSTATGCRNKNHSTQTLWIHLGAALVETRDSPIENNHSDSCGADYTGIHISRYPPDTKVQCYGHRRWWIDRTPSNQPEHTWYLGFVQDLKYDIATIVTKLWALSKQQFLLMANNKSPSSSVT